jgi:hypothetical protein
MMLRQVACLDMDRRAAAFVDPVGPRRPLRVGSVTIGQAAFGLHAARSRRSWVTAFA